MSNRHPECDAALHILRSVARSTEDQRNGREIETARFNVFAALECGDIDQAREWLAALRVAVATYVPDLGQRAAAIQAIERIAAVVAEV